MRLHFSPTSPYVRKVRIVLIETGQADAVELVPAKGNPLDHSQMPVSANPLGKIPALERSDGPALFDSRVICRFLGDRPGGALYPQAPLLWDALTLEALADGMLDAAVAMVYETLLRPADKVILEISDGYWAKIARSLDALEQRWMAHLAGRFDIGHVAVAAALEYLDLRHGGRDWRGMHPALAQWQAQVAERPSLVATRPPAA